jgi:hypothetical protein
MLHQTTPNKSIDFAAADGLESLRTYSLTGPEQDVLLPLSDVSHIPIVSITCARITKPMEVSETKLNFSPRIIVRWKIGDALHGREKLFNQPERLSRKRGPIAKLAKRMFCDHFFSAGCFGTNGLNLCYMKYWGKEGSIR